MEIAPKKDNKRKKMISSYDGQKDDPHLKGHTGTDFRTPVGTPIYSPVDGKVNRNDKDRHPGIKKGNGNRVAILDVDEIEHHFYLEVHLLHLHHQLQYLKPKMLNHLPQQ